MLRKQNKIKKFFAQGIRFKTAFIIVLALHAFAFACLKTYSTYNAQIAKLIRSEKNKSLLEKSSNERVQSSWPQPDQKARIVAVPTIKSKQKQMSSSLNVVNIEQTKPIVHLPLPVSIKSKPKSQTVNLQNDLTVSRPVSRSNTVTISELNSNVARSIPLPLKNIHKNEIISRRVVSSRIIIN